MLLVFDENFSKRLAEGMHLLEKSNPASKIDADVISAEAFMNRRGAEDADLIKAVGKKNGVIITKDKDFKQIKMYEKIIEQNGTRILFFKKSKKLIFFWDILIAIVKDWEELKEKLNKKAPPYVYEFDIKKGISELHL